MNSTAISRAFAALVAAGCLTFGACATTQTADKSSAGSKAPAASASGIAARPELIPVAPLEFTARKPATSTLSNGIKVFTLEDHELPLFSATLEFADGSIAVSKDKTGLDSILSSAWREGGTVALPSEKFDERLEDLAADIGTIVGRETSSITVSGLMKDRTSLMELAAQLATSPALPEDKIELARAQELEGIRRQNDNPGALTRRTYRRVFYGADYPLAFEPTVESVGSITREDVQKFRTEIVGPKNMRIGVSGDFDTNEVLAELEKLFGNLDGAAQQVAVTPAMPATPPAGLYILPRDLSQTNIRMGHIGLPLLHPDYHAIQVYNEIFGVGGFTSRLMSDIRSTRGLTYGVSGMLTMDPYNGEFSIGSSTRTAKSRELVDAAIYQTERMRSEPVSDAELVRAKESLMNSYVFSFDSAAEIVRTRMRHDRLGYPEDWLDRYIPAIRAVTAEDVQRVAREHTDPLKLVILAVGPEAELVPQFTGLRAPTILKNE